MGERVCTELIAIYSSEQGLTNSVWGQNLWYGEGNSCNFIFEGVQYYWA
jgi:hypothetical protein